MKLKHILLTGLAAISLASCNDFLDVDAPSSYTDEFVYSYKSEMERALNGVYAQALVDNLYGNLYQGSLILNSDVDMKDFNSDSHSHDAFQRFDGDAQGGSISNFWNAAYNLIEYANKFIDGVQNSSIYNPNDADMQQWIGEVKCLRAMVYHDLVVMYGDVPFTMVPTSEHEAEYVTPVLDRQAIQDALIADLKEAAKTMKPASAVTVEHCSKEFAQGMIARIALTAGGYSLRPDKSSSTSYGKMERPSNYKEYYQTAMDFADSVISSGTHSLKQDFQDVFVNECNYIVVNDDDPIFEIPFAKMSTGCTGNLTGPSYSASDNSTVGPWGACSGSVRVSAFYRFLFRENDLRREFVNGMWYYGYYTDPKTGALADSVYIRNDRTIHNNKWSKLWTSENNALGSSTSTQTGINFPYMRYADILLMYAETANELNDGPTEKAIDALEQVHKRAFDDGDAAFIAEAKASKDAFQKAVMDERKWEFAGENMRWRDLVRTNTYAEELAYSFLRYYAAAMQNAGGGAPEYYDLIDSHDGYDVANGQQGYISNLPECIYYHGYETDEPIKPTAFVGFKTQFYGYQIKNNTFAKKYPLQKKGYKSLRIFNPYAPAKAAPATGLIKNFGFNAAGWLSADFYQWGNANTGQPNDYIKNSFYGFMRCDANGNVLIVKDGVTSLFDTEYLTDTSKLPVVRYILPYPLAVIQRSQRQYKNYYGY